MMYRGKLSSISVRNGALLLGRSYKHDARHNDLDIQMLSGRLHRQIFPSNDQCMKSDVPASHTSRLRKVISEEFKKHNLALESNTESAASDVNIEFPQLYGSSIDEHFCILAEKQAKPYWILCDNMSKCQLPLKPSQWIFSPGWTMYKNGKTEAVSAPSEEVLVFDIEVLQSDGNGQYPTLATAVSNKAWYSWCSERLISSNLSWRVHVTPDDLIPLEPSANHSKPEFGDWIKRIIIGHNVSYDRSFIKEQYFVKGPKTRFVDTMSLHIATSGFTGFQRMVYNAVKNTTTGDGRKEINQLRERVDGNLEDQEWINSGSMNNLSDVHRLHCGGAGLEKASREVFTSGTMRDVRDRFQELMEYCANDVTATHEVFCKLWPEFTARLPHPVTFAGMLEMGSAYLPVNYNWEKYLAESEGAFSDLQRELKMTLMRAANEACNLVRDQAYRRDPWLWDIDWTVKKMKLNKDTKKKKKKDDTSSSEEESELERMLATADRLPKVAAHMPGYPSWYRDLCPRAKVEDWSPGPSLISTQMRIASKLLRLTWDGYPVHHDEKHGWGYLVPGKIDEKLNRELNAEVDIDSDDFPIRALYEFCGSRIRRAIDDLNRGRTSTVVTPRGDSMNILGENAVAMETSDIDRNVIKNVWHLIERARALQDSGDVKPTGKRSFFKVAKKAEGPGPFFHRGDGPYEPTDKRVRGCWFFRIPHKDGGQKNVGNPLSKTFLSKMEDLTLQGAGGEANRVLELSKMCSYWRNNRDRIRQQMVCWLQRQHLPQDVVESSAYHESGQFGAILPRLVVAGTVTRRAVEPTWLTASNAYPDRIGSELKAIVQAPPGYHLVGADVDSQELWIAALLGDSHAHKLHGCTPFSWMTLQGKKSSGTDLHSKTAEYVGITREHAKVLNYSRIYGAGQPFAERLLMQFNHQLTQAEARAKALEMYRRTKGSRAGGLWTGGTESAMFNKLESIAKSESPATPVLGCQICKPLQPNKVDKLFMTSRVNWVVQSSAVDFLHLMLVCMTWLCNEYNIDARFCISIHDEVRYLVNSKDRYRAALALQITNLLTRAMFAYKLDMPDLPLSVAFFSSVDIDHCLRKEVTFDCRTPSNPLGMAQGYSIPQGEALGIQEILERTDGGRLDCDGVADLADLTLTDANA